MLLILIWWEDSCFKLSPYALVIALNVVSFRISYSLWCYRDSNILAYGYELVLM